MSHIEKDKPALQQRIFDAIVCAVDEEIAEMLREDALDPNCDDCDKVMVEMRMTATAAAAGYYEAEAAMQGMPRASRRRACQFTHRQGMIGRRDEHLKGCSANCRAHQVLTEELAEQN